MSKVIRATCKGGTVTADGVSVPAARILSEGVGESEGVVVLDEDRTEYIAKTSPDLKESIEQIISGLNSAASAIGGAVSALGTLAAVSADPIGFPLTLAAITSAQGGISSAASSLSEIKGRLR